MNESRVIDENNLEEAAANLNAVSEKNESIYLYLEQMLHKKNLSGIREDVLQFLAAHAADFKNDGEYGFHIASFAGNAKAGVEWYEWISEYFSGESQIPIGDFIFVLGEAVNKGMSVDTVKEIVNRDGSDIVKIYREIDGFEEHRQDQEDMAGLSAEKPVEVMDAKKYKAGVQMKKNDYVGLFEGLFSAMNTRHYDEDSTIMNIQSDFNQICAKMQVLLAEISSAAKEMFQEWEKDKAEIGRLVALHKLKQKVFENQQNKIDEMCQEINMLQSKMQRAQQSEVKREAINQKIYELQHLTCDVE